MNFPQRVVFRFSTKGCLRFYQCIFSLLSFPFFTGCATSTFTFDDLYSKAEIPNKWDSSSSFHFSNFNPTKDEKWWVQFSDARLNFLIERVLSRNLSFQNTLLSIEKANHSLNLINTNIVPDVALSFSGGNTKLLEGSHPSSRSYGSSFTLSYEVDLWGKLKHGRNQAQLEVAASEYEQRAASVLLVSSLIKAYWNIAILKEKIELQKLQYDEYRMLADSVYRRKSHGLAKASEVFAARAALADQLVMLNQLNADLITARSAIAALSNDKLLDIVNYEPNGLTALDVAEIIPPLPLEVLARRPDIALSQVRLQQHFSSFEIARLNFYPALTLSAGVSTGGGRLIKDVLKKYLSTIGTQFAIPFIQFRKNRFTLEFERVKFEQEKNVFIDKLHNAILEVETSLGKHSILRSRLASMEHDHADMLRSLELSEQMHQLGLMDAATLLSARQRYRAFYNAFLATRHEFLLSLLHLSQALGGKHLFD